MCLVRTRHERSTEQAILEAEDLLVGKSLFYRYRSLFFKCFLFLDTGVGYARDMR